MYSARKPYYQLKKSISDFFSGYSRFIKQSLEKESVAEKPYLAGEYPQMHLNMPGFSFNIKPYRSTYQDLKPYPSKKITPNIFGQITGDNWSWTLIDFGKASCDWDIFSSGSCIKGVQVITISASYFWETEFVFMAQIVKDTIGGVSLTPLAGSEAGAWDEQNFELIFPENANGTVTICGFVSGDSLLSVLYKNLAGFYVSLISSEGAIFPIQQAFDATRGVEVGIPPPPTLLNSTYGAVIADCGCIDITSSCDPCLGITVVSWDYTLSTETIARSDTVGIFVANGLGPYNWEVSGTGFTLGAAQTVTGENTLIADETACGSATITVTDACEDVATGYVRCTTGVWTLVSNDCTLAGATADYTINAATCWIAATGILGNKKQVDVYSFGSQEGCSNSEPMDCMQFSGYCPPACGSGFEAWVDECGGYVGCVDPNSSWTLNWALSSRNSYEWTCA